jgi:VCBS repeat-containing protein
VNFDSLIHATAVPIATSAGSPGYGVNSLTITTEVTTGTAAFTDPSGRTLTYSAPATSTGGGSVTINPSTGAFTYVPTTAQRQSATTSTTDTFTVTATNGAGRTATQTITVYVKGSPASETA